VLEEVIVDGEEDTAVRQRCRVNNQRLSSKTRGGPRMAWIGCFEVLTDGTAATLSDAGGVSHWSWCPAPLPVADWPSDARGYPDDIV
jgi:hypothetical protein